MIISPAELAEHQADAESQMTLSLAAYRPTGLGPGPDGYKVPSYALVPYATGVVHTPGKVQSSSGVGSDTSTRSVRIGDVDRAVLTGGLHIPVSAPVPTAGEQRGVGWEYEVVAVGGGADPALLGRRYLVVETPAKSFATARRLDVVEV